MFSFFYSCALALQLSMWVTFPFHWLGSCQSQRPRTHMAPIHFPFSIKSPTLAYFHSFTPFLHQTLSSSLQTSPALFKPSRPSSLLWSSPSLSFFSSFLGMYLSPLFYLFHGFFVVLHVLFVVFVCCSS